MSRYPSVSSTSRSSSSLRPCSSALPALPVLVERYLRHLEARGLARGTIEQQTIALDLFVGWLVPRGIANVRHVTGSHIAEYRRCLTSYRYRLSRAEGAPLRPLSPKTRHDRLAVVRHFLDWLVLERVLLLSPFAAIVLTYPRRPLPRHVLSEEEVLSLFAAVDVGTDVGLRNRAILEVLYGSGLRRAEVADLNVSDLDLTGGTVLVRHGKGGRSRIVPLGESASEVLVTYIREGRPSLRTKEGLHHRGVAALFLASNTGRRLSKASIGMIVRNAAKAAGLEGRATPHSLRHAMATHLLRNGADIRHIQELLGHADISTTEIYTHLAIMDLLEVHARCHPCSRRHRVKSSDGKWRRKKTNVST